MPSNTHVRSINISGIVSLQRIYTDNEGNHIRIIVILLGKIPDLSEFHATQLKYLTIKNDEQNLKKAKYINNMEHQSKKY